MGSRSHKKRGLVGVSVSIAMFLLAAYLTAQILIVPLVNHLTNALGGGH